MSGEGVSHAWIVVAVAGTVWGYLQRRTRDEQHRSRAHLSYPFRGFLAAFLPLMGLMALLQLYAERQRTLYLLMLLPAVLAAAIGAASLVGQSRASRRGPRRL